MVFFLSCLVSVSAFSQVKFESASLSSGHGPLSSGLFFESNFSLSNGDAVNVSLGNEDMYIMYLKSLSKSGRLFTGGSLEYYYNVPTLGYVLLTTPIKTGNFSASTFTWTGISAGNPGEKVELLNWGYLFFWQSANLSFKGLTLTGAILNHQGDWGHLFDLKYTQKLNENFSAFTSGGYSFFGDGKALMKIGVTYRPSRLQN